MHKYLFISLFFSVHFSFAQTEITWNDLEDVEFEDVYYDEVDEFIAYPHFGQSVLDLSGVEVSLTGYILALDPDEGYYILSKGPFASCFFCGGGKHVFGLRAFCAGRQVDSKMVILVLMLAYIGALDRHLGSKFLQLGLQ